ncbi:discoidin domain-containing protein [Kribbella sp. NBC_00709]|uniref:discoidin domain-containing protein n=1 Tax=Kribbella sp. NBC_00709 TaxID=2975972 RepID=UPI002E2C61CD|nr:discoidin domain-containing protein [Kribbella sp. NBC_00709]
MPEVQRRDFIKLAAASTAGAVLLNALRQPDADATTAGPNRQRLEGRSVRLEWQRDQQGWRLDQLQLRSSGRWRSVFTPSGECGLWLSIDPAVPTIDEVRRLSVGSTVRFWPESVSATKDAVTFSSSQPTGAYKAAWAMDDDDVVVAVQFTPNADGWYSVTSPTLGTLADRDLGWGVVPGYWNSSTIESDDELAFRYQFGIPTAPVLATEASTTSLVAILQQRQEQVSLGVVADPSLARDPWAEDKITQSTWHVGTSLRTTGGVLGPTIASPVLGQEGSWLTAGQTVVATFRYIVRPTGWYEVNRYVSERIYPVGDYLKLAHATDSLTHRLNRMHDFLVSPQSQWHTWTYDGLTLGAESGKLSDVGAMWMLDALTTDPVIHNDRLPYARNFKLAQQQTAGGPFQGAALGEYFKNDGWITDSEWVGLDAAYVSPIFTTFYTLADMGNMALFTPDDTEVHDRLRLAADRLLTWQKRDGSFDIGYVRDHPQTLQYPELTDYRATWYGFVAAYRVLGDRKYLAAARRGADWFIRTAVATGNYLGVCDDAVLVRDFQVIFAAQALLDLHDLTGHNPYLDAAVTAARVYTQHIYNHPVATTATKTFNGPTVEDWQLSQAGLNFEHAGYFGSANGAGPILLSSHAGSFVRFYELTGDAHFLLLARAAARGRDAFVGATSGIPSYYWSAGNGGSSVFPWHGWWHIGWVVDYLLSEAHLRSGGKVDFPRGFCTAKVGSHRPAGFAPGKVYGDAVELWMPRTLVTGDQPDVDWLTGRSPDGRRIYLIALNQRSVATTATFTLDPRGVEPGKLATWRQWTAEAGPITKTADDGWQLKLEPDGIAVFSVAITLADDPAGPALRSYSVDGPYRTPTVTWSYYATETSWVQWRASDTDAWTDTAVQQGYALHQALDLSSVNAPATVQIRVATQLADGTPVFTEPSNWNVPLQYVPTGPDLALGRPVTVSSTYTPAYTGDKAVDGNRTDSASRWLCSLDDSAPTITIELAAATTPKLLRMFSGPGAAQVVVSFVVQGRTAAGDWQQVGTVTGNTLATTDVALTPLDTDTVRVVFSQKSRDPVDVVRVFEIEIYDAVKTV